jgi:hypothetical protein
MKSLTIKTAAVTAVIVASGLALSAFSAHQTKVKNDKIVAEVTQSTNKALSDIEEYYRRVELGLVSPAEAAARCDSGNEKACDMSVKYMLVRGYGDDPNPLPNTPNPMIEAREKCASNGAESDACIEVELLQPVLDEHNQRILDSYR